MKKYLSLGVSAIVSVLTFILFAFPMLIGEIGTVNGYEFINFNAGVDYITFFSIFGLVVLFVCVLSLAVALLELLKQLNVLKLKFNLAKILTILLYIAVACVLICLISAIIAASNISVFGIGVGIILLAILYLLAVLVKIFVKNEE